MAVVVELLAASVDHHLVHVDGATEQVAKQRRLQRSQSALYPALHVLECVVGKRRVARMRWTHCCCALFPSLALSLFRSLSLSLFPLFRSLYLSLIFYAFARSWRTASRASILASHHRSRINCMCAACSPHMDSPTGCTSHRLALDNLLCASCRSPSSL